VIAGVILAAGTGSRFGSTNPKLVASFRGRPVVEHVVAAMVASPVDALVVVLGHRADEIESSCDLQGARVVRNPDYETGQASSVRAGLRSVPDMSEAAVVALGDQPGITPAVVTALIEGYRRHLLPFTVPTYQGRRGNPVLISRAVFNKVMSLDGDVGARAIMERQPRWVTEVPADALADPRDIDTPEDLETGGVGG